jgi:hypothetical protein
MQCALTNDSRFPSNARTDIRRLRRLVPDSELIRRGAVKETLRSIAADYGVHPTTILRYFNVLRSRSSCSVPNDAAIIPATGDCQCDASVGSQN